MTQIEAIKKEIERLRKESLEYGYTSEQRIMADAGKEIALMNLDNFIESLEQKAQCDRCVNDKGCVTCVDGNMKETQPKGYA